MNNIKKQGINLGIIYVSLITLFLAIMVATYLLPNKRVNWHVNESLQQLKTEGVYPRPFFNEPSAQLDNFTDAWMLNLAISGDNKHPIKSALENPHRVMPSYNEGQIDKVENLVQSVTTNNYEMQNYSRYWHGYLGILKPLLMFFSYTEIRMLNMCALFLLFIIVNSLIKNKLGIRYMVSFFLSAMMVMFIIVPMSLQFSTIFYITFISMIVILLNYQKIYRNNLELPLFFTIGCITSFFDLLTVPLVTLGVPLTTYILLTQLKTPGEEVLPNIFKIIKNSIIWAIGYGMTWASKWVIATIILKRNVITDALNQILSRTSDTHGDAVFTAQGVIERNTDIMFTDFTIKLLVIGVIIWLIAMIYKRKHLSQIIQIAPLLLIAIMPFVWYVVLKNHSYVHSWFTYRNLIITVFSLFAIMSYSIKEPT